MRGKGAPAITKTRLPGYKRPEKGREPEFSEACKKEGEGIVIR